MTISKYCKHCGKEFFRKDNASDALTTTHWRQQKYCDDKCKHSYNNDKNRKLKEEARKRNGERVTMGRKQKREPIKSNTINTFLTSYAPPK